MIWKVLQKQCPNCGSKRIRREERRTKAQKTYLPVLGLFPYHCGKCKSNFLLRTREIETTWTRKQENYIEDSKG